MTQLLIYLSHKGRVPQHVNHNVIFTFYKNSVFEVVSEMCTPSFSDYFRQNEIPANQANNQEIMKNYLKGKF